MFEHGNKEIERLGREVMALRLGFAELKLKQEIMMAQIDDLNAALAKAQSDFTKLSTDVGTAVAGLQSQITTLQTELAAAQGSGVDLTAAIAAANALDASVTALDATVAPAAPVSAPVSGS